MATLGQTLQLRLVWPIGLPALRLLRYEFKARRTNIISMPAANSTSPNRSRLSVNDEKLGIPNDASKDDAAHVMSAAKTTSELFSMGPAYEMLLFLTKGVSTI